MFPTIGYCPLACLFDSFRLWRATDEFCVRQKPMVLFLYDLLCIKPYMNADTRDHTVCCCLKLLKYK